MTDPELFSKNCLTPKVPWCVVIVDRKMSRYEPQAHWCDVCEKYYRSNEQKKHLTSAKHLANAERAMAAKRRERLKSADEEQKMKRELARLEREAMAKGAAEGRVGGAEDNSARFEQHLVQGPTKHRKLEEEEAADKQEVQKTLAEGQEGDESRQQPVSDVAYDPSNPYGQWKEASPKREEDDDEAAAGGGDDDDDNVLQEGLTRKQIKEIEAEKWEEDVEEDPDEGFRVTKRAVIDRVHNESVMQFDSDEEDKKQEEAVVFKRVKKDRSSRKKEHRDINE